MILELLIYNPKDKNKTTENKSYIEDKWKLKGLHDIGDVIEIRDDQHFSRKGGFDHDLFMFIQVNEKSRADLYFLLEPEIYEREGKKYIQMRRFFIDITGVYNSQYIEDLESKIIERPRWELK